MPGAWIFTSWSGVGPGRFLGRILLRGCPIGKKGVMNSHSLFSDTDEGTTSKARLYVGNFGLPTTI